MANHNKWMASRTVTGDSGEVLFICDKCRYPKPLNISSYGISRSRKHGFHSTCKECCRSSMKAKRDESFASTGLRTPEYVRRSWKKNQYKNLAEKKAKRDAKELNSRSTPRGQISNVLKATKYRCLRGDVKFDIDINYMMQIYIDQGGDCAVTGDRMTSIGGGKFVRANCSIDRKNPRGGYEKGNVQLVCRYANTMKNDCDMDELVEFCHKVLIINERRKHHAVV